MRKNLFSAGVVCTAILAATLATAAAQPVDSTKTSAAAMGAEIFRNGARPDIPACSTCHGQEGHGLGDAPQIAGRDQGYLEKQLQDFNTKKRASEPMNKHAWDMTLEQMHAVAAYLSGER